MIILFTAFEGEHNSSYLLIKDCVDNRLIFPNSYDGIDRCIKENDISQYDSVIMFGQDSRLRGKIRIEPQAELDGDVRKTVYFTDDVADILKMHNLQVTIAKRATSYLCNYAYYHVLGETYRRALFIHIPPEEYLTDDIKLNLQSFIRMISAFYYGR